MCVPGGANGERRERLARIAPRFITGAAAISDDPLHPAVDGPPMIQVSISADVHDVQLPRFGAKMRGVDLNPDQT